MTDDLVAFLRAREDEREDSTRKLLRQVQDTQLKLEDPKYLGLDMPGWSYWPDVEEMITKRLAEVEAVRKLIAEYEYWESTARGPDYTGGMAGGLWIALECAALPYGDHPDYQQKWSRDDE